MPTITPIQLNVLFTSAALALAADSTVPGIRLKIASIGLGRGRQVNGQWMGYEPQRNQTALLNEFVRRPITFAEDAAPNTVSLAASFEETPNDPSTAGSAFEVGFYADNGTLVAVWSEDGGAPVIIRSQNMLSVLALILTIDAMPRELVQFLVTPGNLIIVTGSADPVGELLFKIRTYERLFWLETRIVTPLISQRVS